MAKKITIAEFLKATGRNPKKTIGKSKPHTSRILQTKQHKNSMPSKVFQTRITNILNTKPDDGYNWRPAPSNSTGSKKDKKG